MMLNSFRRALVALSMTGAAALAGVALEPTAASAATVVPACTTTAAGGSSGWCALAQGSTANSAVYAGQLSLSDNGQYLTIQTEVIATAAAPANSYACLLVATAASVTTDLGGSACATAGGVLVTWTGASDTIDLSTYSQFYGLQFAVEVGVGTGTSSAVTPSTSGSGSGGGWFGGWFGSWFSHGSPANGHGDNGHGDGGHGDGGHGGCGGGSSSTPSDSYNAFPVNDSIGY
jgi:hypothetical protein